MAHNVTELGRSNMSIGIAAAPIIINVGASTGSTSIGVGIGIAIVDDHLEEVERFGVRSQGDVAQR